MSPPTAWTTADLTADLAAKLRADLFLVVREVTLRGDTGQRADLLAMRRKLADGPMLILEVKTSRGDLLGDLRRDKWRGYLADGAVAFAFPAGLADPREIPAEAGVIVRIPQGWSWKRSPKWHAAPVPTAYLYRRMALSAADQYAERAVSLMKPRPADLWAVARQQRRENGRRLAQIAQDVETWEHIVQTRRQEAEELREEVNGLYAKIAKLSAEERRLEREGRAAA